MPFLGPRENHHTFVKEHHKSFGNSIVLGDLVDEEKGIYKLYGWLRRIPQVGDVLDNESKRGRIHLVFTQINRPGDPPDMFFATARAWKTVLPSGEEIFYTDQEAA